jgi:DNA-binding protein H-NS
VKYRGPNGEVWGGGLGRKPDWVNALGADIEKYRV